MVVVEIESLISQYPRLYHMAERGSWNSIKKFGLLCTTALLDLYEVGGAFRHQIESEHRPESISIQKVGMADAVVRDQKPMSDSGLVRALPKTMTPKDWYEILNRKTFFWTSENRLHRLLGAKAYSHLEHDVITIDTESLVSVHRDNVKLCPYNSGCTKPMPRERDESIFSSLADYDIEKWASRPRWDRIVELCVEGGVPDVNDHVVSVTRMKGKEIISRVL